MVKIFVYGTLMLGDVRERVLNKKISGEYDSLKGYRLTTHPVLTSYPVIETIPEWHNHTTVDGMVFEVDNDDLIKLDRYESTYYKRINVTLESGLECMVYVENKFID